MIVAAGGRGCQTTQIRPAAEAHPQGLTVLQHGPRRGQRADLEAEKAARV
jgi:hypothetical protein